MFSDKQRKGNPLNLRITIRMTVVSAFVLATVLTGTLGIGLHYYFGQRLATEATRSMYDTATGGIAQEIQRTGDNNGHLLELLAHYAAMAGGIEDREHLPAITDLMLKKPLFYGIYLGRTDGRFYEVVNLAADPQARALLEARKDDRWVLIDVEPPRDPGGKSRQQYRYLDANLRQRAVRNEQVEFDPTQRPWYRSAIANEQVHRTDLYTFAQLGVPGRTLSLRVPGEDMVLAIDITLTSLNAYLAELAASHSSEIFIYNTEGEVLASSTSGSARRRVAIEDLLAIATDPAQRQRLVQVQHRGEPHFAFGAPLYFEDDQARFFLGILAPRAVIMGPLLEQLKLSIAIAGIALLLLLPLSWFFASPIVNPVIQLATETEKVKRREFEQVNRVPTQVVELDQLSASMVTMADSIKQHEEEQEELMESIIRLIAQAIDDKSPYTGGHCERVPELAIMLAEQASASKEEPFEHFRLATPDQWREFRIAAWLHDCGKLTTPEHIVDKGSKLEVIYNRIHEVRLRFEVLWRDAEIEFLRAAAEQPDQRESLGAELRQRQRQLQDDFAFIAQCNVGAEDLDDASLQRLRKLAKTTWVRHFDDTLGLSPAEEMRLPPHSHPPPATERLLSDKPEQIQLRDSATNYPKGHGIRMDIPEYSHNHGELYNLSIRRGTLTPEDRFIIKEHMISTIKMLDGLPFPPELSRVPRIASTHHETLDGRGYPRRLDAEQLSVEERILAIADVFEALTAADRPYKRAKTVNEAIAILHRMVQRQHLDRPLFELFLRRGVYLQYARQFLPPEQIDSVDLDAYLGD